MQEGDVIVASISQADGTVKKRPLIVLRKMPPYNDLLVCGVSKQLHQEAVGFDEIIAATDADFADSGLKSVSLIRLGFLAVLPAREALGAIGFIAPERHRRLLQALSDHLTA